jgi:hypothetical protein
LPPSSPVSLTVKGTPKPVGTISAQDYFTQQLEVAFALTGRINFDSFLPVSDGSTTAKFTVTANAETGEGPEKGVDKIKLFVSTFVPASKTSSFPYEPLLLSLSTGENVAVGSSGS